MRQTTYVPLTNGYFIVSSVDAILDSRCWSNQRHSWARIVPLFQGEGAPSLILVSLCNGPPHPVAVAGNFTIYSRCSSDVENAAERYIIGIINRARRDSLCNRVR